MTDAVKPNLKRKHREISKDDLPTKVAGKLHHELQEVHQACKKAKTFETQKLVKKLKSLRKDSNESPGITEHEAQLGVMKDVDLRQISNTAFRTKVLKGRLLRDNEILKEALEKEITTTTAAPPTPGTPLAKVQARLLSSKHLAVQIQTSLDSLKAVIDPEFALQNKKKLRTPSADQPKPHAPSLLSQMASVSRSDNDESDGEEGDDLIAHGSESESADIGPEDDGWESGSIGSDGAEDTGASASRIQGLDDSDLEDSDASDLEEDEEVATSRANKVAPPPKATAIARSSLKAKESTFLPSLAVGYVSGSDDSDIEDEANVAEPRKNRRGQRARRAIWEKKYGKNANHTKAAVKVLAEVQRSKPRSNNGNTRKERRSKGYSAPQVSGANTTALVSRDSNPAASKSSNSATKGLHPSWEAKRKLKEKERDAIVPSQGKKIKFQ
ncbi:Bud-site selection protein [Coprinopsis marcescibilis]|uniref:Bud-site selection protein n=1 Tax=Coprinopsis marcescibilis TaxID=230819 RepID=A0A5C3LGT7_COPMA|nr:Bud-site selection protein [Coprinopsis marcescibilis]